MIKSGKWLFLMVKSGKWLFLMIKSGKWMFLMVKSGKWMVLVRDCLCWVFPFRFFPRCFSCWAICTSCPTRFNSTEPGDVPVALGGSAISTWKKFSSWWLSFNPLEKYAQIGNLPQSSG